MGSYKIDVNSTTKVIESKIEGVMSVQDASGFIIKYKQVTASIPLSQYTLIFDCTGLGVSPKESQEKLFECFQLYKKANFKHIVFNTGNNSILKIQLNRMLKAAELNNCEVK